MIKFEVDSNNFLTNTLIYYVFHMTLATLNITVLIVKVESSDKAHKMLGFLSSNNCYLIKGIVQALALVEH